MASLVLFLVRKFSFRLTRTSFEFFQTHTITFSSRSNLREKSEHSNIDIVLVLFFDKYLTCNRIFNIRCTQKNIYIYITHNRTHKLHEILEIQFEISSFRQKTIRTVQRTFQFDTLSDHPHLFPPWTRREWEGRGEERV